MSSLRRTTALERQQLPGLLYGLRKETGSGFRYVDLSKTVQFPGGVFGERETGKAGIKNPCKNIFLHRNNRCNCFCHRHLVQRIRECTSSCLDRDSNCRTGHHLVFFIREMSLLRKWIILHAPHSEPLPGLWQNTDISRQFHTQTVQKGKEEWS